MLINWFTVGAQMVNFLILVWLMRRFLYRPVLAAIDTRAKEIAARLAGADTKMAEAARQLSEYQDKSKTFEDTRTQRLSDVAGELKVIRETQMKSIQTESDTARKAASMALHTEQASFADELGRMVEAEVFAISQKAVSDLADANLEHQTIVKFMRQLATTTEANFKPLVAALVATRDATVMTSFLVSDTDRGLLTGVIKSLAGVEVTLQFERAANHGFGISLACDGQRAAWNLDAYLDVLNAKSSVLVDDCFPASRLTEPVVASLAQPVTGGDSATANDSVSAIL